MKDDERPLPNKKVIDLFKDGLGGKIMIEFVAYLMDDGSEYKKRNKKMCSRKRNSSKIIKILIKKINLII